MPGYGPSAPMAEMSFASLCDRLCAALDALGIDRVVIAGQSIGGMIAQEMAIRHPHRIAGLFPIATVPAFGGRDDSFAILPCRTAAPLDKVSMADLAAEAIPAVMGPKRSGTRCRHGAYPAGGLSPGSADACHLQPARGPASHLLPRCLIAGAHDDNSPARVMEKWRSVWRLRLSISLIRRTSGE